MKSILKLLALISISFAMTCKHAPALRVLTYNIRLDTPADGVNQWPKRKEKVATLLLEQNPDVFGVQEALHNQMLDLEALLPKYAWCGAGRDDGKTAGEFSAIFYKKDLFTLVDSGTFWLSETPAVPGSKSWDAAITRVCSWAKLSVNGTGRQFFVFNTHFDHIGQTARLRSMELIAQKTQEIAGSSPFVLMGDFNCEPDSAPYAVAADSSKWQITDTWAAAKLPSPACTFTGFKVAGAECRRIDYVFVSPFFKANSCQIISQNDGTYYPSDHLPVVVDLVPK